MAVTWGGLGAATGLEGVPVASSRALALEVSSRKVIAVTIARIASGRYIAHIYCQPD